MQTSTSSYLLNVGDADRERLEILSGIYDEGSREFLKKHIPPSAGTFIDVGCGHGQLACWAAEQFPKMRVFGLDISDEQLSICATHAGRQGVANVTFEQRDMLSVEPPPVLADIVYSRYVLLHIKDWEVFFANLLAMCKPGGRVLLEEPGFPFFSYPRSEFLDRANTLGLALTTRLKLHFDCIDALWPYVHHLEGVELKGHSFSQPTVTDTHRKGLLWRSFLQIREPLIATGISTPEEIAAIINGLQAIANDPLSLVGSLRMIQLWLEKKME